MHRGNEDGVLRAEATKARNGRQCNGMGAWRRRDGVDDDEDAKRA